MENITNLLISIVTKSAFFMGFIAFIGLLIRKESINRIVEGTLKTILGLVILSSGVHVFTDKITPLLSQLKDVYGIIGLIPDNQSPFSLIVDTYALSIPIVFVISFILHILIVKISKITRLKNIFLSAHIMMFLSGFYVLVLSTNTSLSEFMIILMSIILQTLTITIFPFISRKASEEIVGTEFTLGHMFNLSLLIGNITGKLLKTKKVSSTKKESTYNFNVILGISLPILFIIIGSFIGKENISNVSGNDNWIIYLIYEGLQAAAGLIIIMYGIKMFLDEIIYSFKGISEKYIHNSVPALDAVAFFKYYPVGVLTGFIGHILGAVICILVLIMFDSNVLAIPSPLFMFFEGALAGVFAYRNGGTKAAITAGCIVGFLTHLSVIFLYPLQETIVQFGVIYGGADLLLVAPILWLLKILF